MIRNSGQHVPEITFVIDPVQFGCAEQDCKSPRHSPHHNRNLQKENSFWPELRPAKLIPRHYYRFRCGRHHRSASTLCIVRVRNEQPWPYRIFSRVSLRSPRTIVSAIPATACCACCERQPFVRRASADFFLDGIQRHARRLALCSARMSEINALESS